MSPLKLLVSDETLKKSKFELLSMITKGSVAFLLRAGIFSESSAKKIPFIPVTMHHSTSVAFLLYFKTELAFI